MAKESFADLFSRGEVVIAKAKTLRNGDEAEGLVAYISSDAIFLDLDDKQQAFFERIAFQNFHNFQPLDSRALRQV